MLTFQDSCYPNEMNKRVIEKVYRVLDKTKRQ